MKITYSTAFIVLSVIAMTSTTSAFELWYRRCGKNGKPTGPIRKELIPGYTCVSLDQVDPKLCKVITHDGRTGCKQYKDSDCTQKGIVRHGYINCAEPDP
ncbi:hypothetical protein BGX34_010144 [Mortierella sp. NVP85]|nr:hypothetical protein BGX34_010144 [Mortierella sp. NVP85]